MTSIGIGHDAFWQNVLAGCSGFTPVQSFGTSGYKVSKGGEIQAFEADVYIRTLDPASIGRASQFAVAAARLAVDDAALDLGGIDPEQGGVSIGTTSGEPREVERFNDHMIDGTLDRVGAEFIAAYPCNVLTVHIAREIGLNGLNMMIPAACAAGNHAIAYAFDALRTGRAEVMLAGGADAFSRITYTGFARLGAIAPEVCQPFDRNRKGMIPGEGAAVIVLEPLERALERGARIYAEVAGYGLSCDAYHITAAHPQGAGAVRAMEKALDNSGLTLDRGDYISAHGTGTPTNDLCETIAVKRVFGDHAQQIPISSIKSMIGHTMGAAAAIETVVCALAITDHQVPPTMHLQTPDPDCDLDYVAHAARAHPVRVAMNNAYAFGGNNSPLVLKQYV